MTKMVCLFYGFHDQVVRRPIRREQVHAHLTVNDLTFLTSSVLL